MFFIKKHRKKYPVVNTPISKLYLVEMLEKYPQGIFINNGKRLKFVNSNTTQSLYNVKIDFINSAKLLGLILGVYYFFNIKKKVKKRVNKTLYNTEERLNQLRDELLKKKRSTMNDDLSFYSDE